MSYGSCFHFIEKGMVGFLVSCFHFIEKGNGRFPCTLFVGMFLLDLSLTLVEGDSGDYGERVMTMMVEAVCR